jgi:hypothetical protein
MKAIAIAPMSLVLTVAVAAAAAPTKEQCIAADTDAQTLRMSGKLRAAREKLSACVDAACPSMVRDDCTQRLDEIQQVQPTIVFEVKDPKGDDLGDVAVTMDGEPLMGRIGGTAVAVDPGAHKFAFEAPGRPRVEKTLVLREGEKGRRERVVLPPAEATPSAPAGSTPPPGLATPAESPAGGGAPATSDGSGQRTVGLVTGGVGIAGLALGSVFGAMTISAWSNSKNECSASTAAQCPNHAQAVSDHDSAVSDGLVSTIAFVAGGAALVAGAVLYFTAPRATGSQVGLRVAPILGPGAAGAALGGSF